MTKFTEPRAKDRLKMELLKILREKPDANITCTICTGDEFAMLGVTNLLAILKSAAHLINMLEGAHTSEAMELIYTLLNDAAFRHNIMQVDVDRNDFNLLELLCDKKDVH